MDIAFGVRDYRILKTIRVRPKGITLIYGENGGGKSTLSKALVTLLSNQSSPNNFRHGKDSFTIIAKFGDSKLKYVRENESTSIQYNDEPERTKLGKHPMSVIEPRFPLKRVDYENSSFYPNFSFQNSVPIFNDVSVYELFGSMFSNLAQVNTRVNQLRAEGLALSKENNSLESNLNLAASEIDTTLKDIQTLKDTYTAKVDPTGYDLDTLYSKFKQHQSLTEEITKQQVEVNRLKPVDYNQALFELTSKALEADMFTVYQQYQSLHQKIAEKERLMARLKESQELLESLPPAFDGVEKYHQLKNFKSKLNSLETTLESIPEIDSYLIAKVQELQCKRVSLSVAQGNLELQTQELSEVQEQLKTIPCPTYAQGLCPYINKEL